MKALLTAIALSISFSLLSFVYLSSGKPLKYEYFNGYNPDFETEKCVYIIASVYPYLSWKTWPCHKKAASICEKDLGKYSSHEALGIDTSHEVSDKWLENVLTF